MKDGKENTMKQNNDKEASRQLCERAYRLFDEFRSAYRQEWLRLENNERIYRGDHWYDVPVTDENEPRPVTPIIQSTVENVSADLMDQAPEAHIRPEAGYKVYGEGQRCDADRPYASPDREAESV